MTEFLQVLVNRKTGIPFNKPTTLHLNERDVPSLVAPDAYVLRYLNYWQFREMFLERILRLKRIDLFRECSPVFGDCDEGLVNPNARHADHVEFERTNRIKNDEPNAHFENTRITSFASCWIKGKDPERELWDRFRSEGESFCVVVQVRKLLQALAISPIPLEVQKYRAKVGYPRWLIEDGRLQLGKDSAGVYVRAVRYFGEEQSILEMYPWTGLCKRNVYELEREVRLLITHDWINNRPDRLSVWNHDREGNNVESLSLPLKEFIPTRIFYHGLSDERLSEIRAGLQLNGYSREFLEARFRSAVL
jgi:hypothetical protein